MREQNTQAKCMRGGCFSTINQTFMICSVVVGSGRRKTQININFISLLHMVVVVVAEEIVHRFCAHFGLAVV